MSAETDDAPETDENGKYQVAVQVRRTGRMDVEADSPDEAYELAIEKLEDHAPPEFTVSPIIISEPDGDLPDDSLESWGRWAGRHSDKF